MEEQIKKGVNSWLEFMDLRYKTEKSFLDVIDNNDIQFGNGAFNELITNGVRFSRAFMETRYKLERQLVNSLSKIDISKEEEKSGVSIEKENTGSIHSGIIRVVVPQSEQIAIPIHLNNDFDEEQKIEIHASEIINLENSKSVSGNLEIAESKFAIQPKSSAATHLKLNANGRVFKPGKNYAARIEIQGFQHKTLDVFISVVDKGKTQKVSFEKPK